MSLQIERDRRVQAAIQQVEIYKAQAEFLHETNVRQASIIAALTVQRNNFVGLICDDHKEFNTAKTIENLDSELFAILDPPREEQHSAHGNGD